jgi:PIN domain nuclease of toxin-antitoxin system
LIDTHVMLWWALGNSQLSIKARSLLADEGNDCVVSVASVWEVAIKSALGRGLPPGVTGARYASLVEEAGFALRDVTGAHALAVERLAGVHGDPFDRLMVAQAAVDDFALLTQDHTLAAYGPHVIAV